jgi:hypothetical protein
VVAYHARDWVVRGTLRFDDGGYKWAEHLISDARDQHCPLPRRRALLWRLGPDRIPPDVKASTLLDPVILDYQRREWIGY